jgi:hypothetical protein
VLSSAFREGLSTLPFWNTGAMGLARDTASPGQGLGQKLPSDPNPTPSWSSLLAQPARICHHQHLVSSPGGSAITTSAAWAGLSFLRPHLLVRARGGSTRQLRLGKENSSPPLPSSSSMGHTFQTAYLGSSEITQASLGTWACGQQSGYRVTVGGFRREKVTQNFSPR